MAAREASAGRRVGTSPAERVAYLERTYTKDVSLRDDIEPLLASEQRLQDQFLDRANLAAAAATLVSP